MNRAWQIKTVGQVTFVFRLPAGQAEFSGLFPTLHVRIQRWGVGGGAGGTDPPVKLQKYRVPLAKLARIPLKSQSYQSSIQCWAKIGPPAKYHLNGVSLSRR